MIEFPDPIQTHIWRCKVYQEYWKWTGKNDIVSYSKFLQKIMPGEIMRGVLAIWN